MTQTKVTAEPGKQELFIEREFDAPRELVFKAHTDPELYASWVGPNNLTTVVEVFETSSGGSWRFVSTDPVGNEFRFHGVYHEVSFPERMIGTFEYDELPEKGHVSLDTANFYELSDGRTKLVIHSVYQTVADRDAMIESGMEQGLSEGYERLDAILQELKVQV